MVFDFPIQLTLTGQIEQLSGRRRLDRGGWVVPHQWGSQGHGRRLQKEGQEQEENSEEGEKVGAVHVVVVTVACHPTTTCHSFVRLNPAGKKEPIHVREEEGCCCRRLRDKKVPPPSWKKKQIQGLLLAT